MKGGCIPGFDNMKGAYICGFNVGKSRVDSTLWIDLYAGLIPEGCVYTWNIFLESTYIS